MPGLTHALLAQRGHLLLWVPVCLGVGIGVYFSLPAEPSAVHWLVLALAAACAAALASHAGEAAAPLVWALVLVAVGVALGGWRSHQVSAPVLGFRYYGPVEGRIVAIDRSASDAVRLTLDRVRLDRVSLARRPERVRVSLHGDQRWLTPAPGQRIAMTAHLGPPNGPVEPGGFDFAGLRRDRAADADKRTGGSNVHPRSGRSDTQAGLRRARAAGPFPRDRSPGKSGQSSRDRAPGSRA